MDLECKKLERVPSGVVTRSAEAVTGMDREKLLESLTQHDGSVPCGRQQLGCTWLACQTKVANLAKKGGGQRCHASESYFDRSLSALLHTSDFALY